VIDSRSGKALEFPEFLGVVDRLGGVGGFVRQLAKPPRHNPSFDDRRAAVRTARYRAFGLRVGFDLPHAREDALIFAIDEETLSAALSRLGLWQAGRNQCPCRRRRTDLLSTDDDRGV
jgi:hypothetical protein